MESSDITLIAGSGLLLVAMAGVARWVVGVVRARARLARALDIEMLQVLLPKDISGEEEGGVSEQLKAKIGVAEQLLSTLVRLPSSWWDRWLYGRPLIIFEIEARDDGLIAFYAGTEHRYLDLLEKQIYALYPDAEVNLARDFTIFSPGDNQRVGYLTLRQRPHLPIATYQELHADPMQSLTGALAKLQRKDAAMIQFVCQPALGNTRQRGKRSARRATQGGEETLGQDPRWQYYKDTLLAARVSSGEQLTPRGQQRVQLVEEKAAQAQFDVTIRVAVSARQVEETQRVFTGIVAAFSQYDLPDLNGLKLVRPRNQRQALRDLIFRLPSTKLATTLSVRELASLYHFPLPNMGTPNVAWRGAKSAPVPPGLPREGVQLGVNRYRGIDTPVYLAEEDRRRHVYMIGQTGVGKSTLFLQMISQDIAAGRGVGVVDPHGDLIEDILLHIPPQRHQDVVLFDPRDSERPLGFNILEAEHAGEQDLVVNETVNILQKLAARLNPESIGPMFEHYLRNALLALTTDPAATLVDIPRMFVDQDFRTAVLARTDNPTVLQFWRQEFQQSQKGQLSADMLSYVISKLGRFISNRSVRNIVGQASSSFSVRRVMDEGKILLCNLSKGSLGDINSDLLGFVLVAKIQIAALGRAALPESARRDFYLYLDEFQNFTTDSIAVILSEARKYRLNLNLTHQFIQQLPDQIREAVFGNVGTIISYRVGVEDAETLSRQFEPVFKEYDLLNLERFVTCVRLLAAGTPQRPFSMHTLAPPAAGDAAGRDAIRSWCRTTYGRQRVDVERDIVERFQWGKAAPTTPPGGGGAAMSESLLDVS
jgi:hypothetical protein